MNIDFTSPETLLLTANAVFIIIAVFLFVRLKLSGKKTKEKQQSKPVETIPSQEPKPGIFDLDVEHIITADKSQQTLFKAGAESKVEVTEKFAEKTVPPSPGLESKVEASEEELKLEGELPEKEEMQEPEKKVGKRKKPVKKEPEKTAEIKEKPKAVSEAKKKESKRKKPVKKQSEGVEIKKKTKIKRRS